MTNINALTLDVPDISAAEVFYDKAFGLGDRLRFQAAASPSRGFRGFVISLVVADPTVADSLLEPALDAGATVLKPAKKSFWGYGGVIQTPDGAIWKVASSSKKPTGAPAREFDDLVLLLGVDDVAATKQFYVDRGVHGRQELRPQVRRVRERPGLGEARSLRPQGRSEGCRRRRCGFRAAPVGHRQ